MDGNIKFSLLFMLIVSDVYSITISVYQTADKAVLGDNPFTLSCTYTIGSLDKLYSIELMRKRESDSDFTTIVTFQNPSSPLNVTYQDTSLESRTVATKPKDDSKTATLVFNTIECNDKATYKWKAFYTDGTNKNVEDTSTVTVKAKTLFGQEDHRSLSYSASTSLEEGDSVVFICSGDVGNEPVGHLGWFYYLNNSTLSAINASTRATSTAPVYQSTTCSYTRTSTLQLTMTREFNNIIVRCTGQQDRYDQFGDGHVQTDNIPVFYTPRVSSLSNITIEEGQSVHRMCTGDSYPEAFYRWQLPNGSEIDGPSLTIRNAKVEDTGLYKCTVYNTFKGQNHTDSTTIFIEVWRTTTMPNTVSATTTSNIQKEYSLKEAVYVKCSDYSWNITVDMDRLRRIYPTAKTPDLYLGENKCRGVEEGRLLVFQHSLFECLTSETLIGGMKVSNNELIYAEHDPVYLFIVLSYNWTVGVECDIRQNGTATGRFPANATSSTSQGIGSLQYPVSLLFYNDQDFAREIGKGNPLHAKIGSQIYVKVLTNTTDWNIRMRIHTCYTKPTEHAHDHTKYFLIKDGCEVNTNTHIISQAPRETKFVFRSFEYSNSHEGIYVFCDAIFCSYSDISSKCLQTCNPVT